MRHAFCNLFGPKREGGDGTKVGYDAKREEPSRLFFGWTEEVSNVVLSRSVKDSCTNFRKPREGHPSCLVFVQIAILFPRGLGVAPDMGIPNVKF